jgi:hypothetical protein
MPRVHPSGPLTNYRPRLIRGRNYLNDDNPETRIGSLILPQSNGCWLYRGETDRYGQASLKIDGETRNVTVHRFVYETLVGPIPEGHQVHHECETPGCCNPKHLIALTPGDHGRRHAEMRRGSAPQAPPPVRRRGKTPDDFIAALRRTT